MCGITDPNNSKLFRDVAEVGTRKVVSMQPGLKVVEVEQLQKIQVRVCARVCVCACVYACVCMFIFILARCLSSSSLTCAQHRTPVRASRVFNGARELEGLCVCMCVCVCAQILWMNRTFTTWLLVTEDSRNQDHLIVIFELMRSVSVASVLLTHTHTHARTPYMTLA